MSNDSYIVSILINSANNGLQTAKQYLRDVTNAALRANKPFILEEYGFPRANVTPSRREVLEDLHDFSLFRSPALNGDLLWSYGDRCVLTHGGHQANP